eukprot:TRINITY_DN8721_c0_g1_i1.p1 TRINITY_DN8721_c0_g1~~TRINITY_DN8721_c0_g1_i1.p1  ORF type:complete len:463 (-),score=51.47 TRINITY_DN8721_c0_g1_i1:393-1781(-)
MAQAAAVRQVPVSMPMQWISVDTTSVPFSAATQAMPVYYQPAPAHALQQATTACLPFSQSPRHAGLRMPAVVKREVSSAPAVASGQTPLNRVTLRNAGRKVISMTVGQGVVATKRTCAAQPVTRQGCRDTRSRTSLADFVNGPYFVVASFAGLADLRSLDATCTQIRTLNCMENGPYFLLGQRLHYGLELDRDGLFDRPLPGWGYSIYDRANPHRSKAPRKDWKLRLGKFQQDMRSFCAPFEGREIRTVDQPDEIAYFQCRLCSDMLKRRPDVGRWIEVDVLANPNNLSLALVDFEEGGCSSVTFSPDTGAVIRETKVQESPRKVEGAYIQTLPVVATDGRPFHGSIGLYLAGEQISFFRRTAEAETAPGAKVQYGPWETTGFISDLGWAEGTRLTPCIAFRDNGAYHVRIVSVGSQEPPMNPAKQSSAVPYEPDTAWNNFDWEGDNVGDDEEGDDGDATGP